MGLDLREGTPHIFSQKVLLVFQDPPWSDSNGTHLSSRLRGMVLQGISHMTDHPCRRKSMRLRDLFTGSVNHRTHCVHRSYTFCHL